jgi:hypothetical protein
LVQGNPWRGPRPIQQGSSGSAATATAGLPGALSATAKRLKKHGFKESTEASVTNKLARGTFPATWFLAVLAALELDGVALEEI